MLGPHSEQQTAAARARLLLHSVPPAVHRAAGTVGDNLPLDDIIKTVVHKDTIPEVKDAYVNFLTHCYIDTGVEMKEIDTSAASPRPLPTSSSTFAASSSPMTSRS